MIACTLLVFTLHHAVLSLEFKAERGFRTFWCGAALFNYQTPLPAMGRITSQPTPFQKKAHPLKPPPVLELRFSRLFKPTKCLPALMIHFPSILRTIHSQTKVSTAASRSRLAVRVILFDQTYSGMTSTLSIPRSAEIQQTGPVVLPAGGECSTQPVSIWYPLTSGMERTSRRM